MDSESLRDYHEDLAVHLASSLPSFDCSETTMWSENAPAKNSQEAVDSALGEAELKIQGLEATRDKTAWDGDTLKLCRDATMCAKLVQAAMSNERTQRQVKITHLKEQNNIGASIVAKFARKQCHHVSTSCSEADAQLSQASFVQKEFNWHCQGVPFPCSRPSRPWCFQKTF